MSAPVALSWAHAVLGITLPPPWLRARSWWEGRSGEEHREVGTDLGGMRGGRGGGDGVSGEAGGGGEFWSRVGEAQLFPPRWSHVPAQAPQHVMGNSRDQAQSLMW